MRTTTLYLVRHGETDFNRHGIVQGRGVDTSLNTTGCAQAAAVGRRLAEVPFDVLYTSTLRRAVETLEVIARAHGGVPVYRLADLQEMAWGIYEGAPQTPEVRQALDALATRWRKGEYDIRIEGGESILDVQRRGRKAVTHILDHHPGATILVVTHGRFLRILLATLLDDYGLERMHDIQHTNTGVNKLIWRDGRFDAVFLNSTDHLPDLNDVVAPTSDRA